jgi:hypothetical protein
VRRLAYFLPLVFLAGCALISKLLPPEPPSDVPATAIRLPGTESLVAGIALRELLEEEREDTAQEGGLEPDGGIRAPVDGGASFEDGGWDAYDASGARCYMDPATYEAWVYPDPQKHLWKVVLTPAAPCARGAYGGGGAWDIDADTFQVIHRERFE